MHGCVVIENIKADQNVKENADSVDNQNTGTKASNVAESESQR